MSEPKLLDFHVYRRQIFNTPADKRYCVAAIFTERAGSHQCGRKPKFEYGGHGWCAQHYPPNVHKRRAELEAKREREWQARTAQWDREEAEDKQKAAALEAIKKIAAGHNDPRGLAMEVLALNPQEPPHE